jgi:hypothetical protein
VLFAHFLWPSGSVGPSDDTVQPKKETFVVWHCYSEGAYFGVDIGIRDFRINLSIYFIITCVLYLTILLAFSHTKRFSVFPVLFDNLRKSSLRFVSPFIFSSRENVRVVLLNNCH